MMKSITAVAVGLLAIAVGLPRAGAHCQVPCGIYDDQARFAMIEEDLVTIEKAMDQARALAGRPAEANQLVRWVLTKERHADHVSEILSTYFLAQRIQAPSGDDPAARQEYLDRLEAIHRMTVSAMKCKQTTDPAHVEELRETLAGFHVLYFGPPSDDVHGP